jgi:hypothetical protein
MTGMKMHDVDVEIDGEPRKITIDVNYDQVK